MRKSKISAGERYLQLVNTMRKWPRSRLIKAVFSDHPLEMIVARTIVEMQDASSIDMDVIGDGWLASRARKKAS